MKLQDRCMKSMCNFTFEITIVFSWVIISIVQPGAFHDHSWLVVAERELKSTTALHHDPNNSMSKMFILPADPDPWQAILSLEAGVWSEFKSLINVKKGDSCDAIAHLKNYFAQFGYLDLPEGMTASADFDDAAEAAIRLYQQWFGLPITGMLDLPTIYQLILPRCGRADVIQNTFASSSMKATYNPKTQSHAPTTESYHPISKSQDPVNPNDQEMEPYDPQTKASDQKLKPYDQERKTRDQEDDGLWKKAKHYAFFPGNPKWADINRTLNYAFSPSLETTRLTATARSAAIARAFARWSKIIPLTFKETASYDEADIKIEFAYGDHQDGQPFDGVLGILAHAFSPEDGRFHLDNAEYWTDDLSTDGSSFAMDLESVAMHEIGHLIGLGHSSAKDAIMFPSLSPREVKRELADDDVEGAQALYGATQGFQSTENTDQSASSAIARVLKLKIMWIAIAVHIIASVLLGW